MKLLPGVSCEGEIYGNLEYGSEELEESSLLYSLGSECGSEIGLSYDNFEVNEDVKVEVR